MIRLGATNEKLQVKLAGAITTNQLDCYATYTDGTTAAYGPGASAQAATNNTTAVDLVGSPAASTTRDIDHVSVFNADTVSATATVQWTNGTQTRILRKVTLAAGEMLEYTHGSGWVVMDTGGNRRGVTSTTLPSLTVTGVTTLNGNVTAAGTLDVSSNLTSGGVVQALGTFQSSSGADIRLKANGANRDIKFDVNGTEYGTFVSSSGQWKFSSNGTYNITASTHGFAQHASGIAVLEIRHGHASNPAGLYQYWTNCAPNNTANAFAQFQDNAAARFGVYANGGIYNYSANNVNLSDESVKTEIQPMPSFWDEHKKVAWCSFKYKDQTHADRNFGYRAQNIRYVFAEKAPELVDHCWPTPKVKALNEKGEEILDENGACVMIEDQSRPPLLAVYDRDLLAITQAVVSEAQKRIEELEQDNADMKRRLAALEAKLK